MWTEVHIFQFPAIYRCLIRMLLKYEYIPVYLTTPTLLRENCLYSRKSLLCGRNAHFLRLHNAYADSILGAVCAMQNNAIVQEKKKLRARMRARLCEFSHNQAECCTQAQRLCARVCSLPVYKDALVLLAFIPMPTEISVVPLIEQALYTDGKAVAVPRVQGAVGEMEFCFLNRESSLNSQLQIGAYGIREPVHGLPLFVPECASAEQKAATLVLVPGLLFGTDGSRLGQGGGYYDRYLRRLQTCGFAVRCVPCGYDIQFVKSVPVEDTDMLLTFF